MSVLRLVMNLQRTAIRVEKGRVFVSSVMRLFDIVLLKCHDWVIPDSEIFELAPEVPGPLPAGVSEHREVRIRLRTFLTLRFTTGLHFCRICHVIDCSTGIGR